MIRQKGIQYTKVEIPTVQMHAVKLAFGVLQPLKAGELDRIRTLRGKNTELYDQQSEKGTLISTSGYDVHNITKETRMTSKRPEIFL